jgi:hypothetical protein
MKTRDLTVIGLAALASMTVTLAFLWPSDAVAKGPGDDLQPVIAVPTIRISGCTLRLRSDKSIYNPGEKPYVILETSNPTDKVVTLEAILKMLLRAPIADTRSRAAPSSRPSRPAWTQPCTLVLAPGDTRSFSVPAPQILVSGTAGSFLLEINGALVASTSFTVAATSTGPSIPQARSTARR